MFSHRPVFKSSLALLLVFFVPSASVVVAQQDDKNTTLMTSDDNNDSSRVMTNYNTLREEGQGFYYKENPDSVVASFISTLIIMDM